jgi:IPT/TIG domain
MFDRWITEYAGAKVVVRFVTVALVLCLIGCGGSSSPRSMVTPSGPPSISSLTPSKGVVGASVTISGANFGSTRGSVSFNGSTASIVSWSDMSIVAKVPLGASTGNVVVTVGGTASNGVSFAVETLPSGSIAASDFGFQCGTNSTNCPNEIWPTSIAQPGLLRLWDSGTNWNDIEASSPGQYTWTTLDNWLDTIYAQTQSNPWGTGPDVMLTFGFVSCLETTGPSGPKGCISPPTDLTASGSLSFNNFVTALVNHCNPNQRCVKDLIKYYEMWNEPNNINFWSGTELQIYQMVAPAVGIIRGVVNGSGGAQQAVITTMASTADAAYTATWLGYENSFGVISDVVVWHQYLNVQQTEIIPEDPANLAALSSLLSAKNGVSGWSAKPWMITETGFQAFVPPYNCRAFTATDCIGQMVRWQLIVLSNGAQSLDWYSWNVNIGSQPPYAQAWYSMMQYVVGGTFSAPCSLTGSSQVWTCDFTETDNTAAKWVWTTNSAGASYTVPVGSGYVDYLSLTGTTGASTAVNEGQSINISTTPIMLEK